MDSKKINFKNKGHPNVYLQFYFYFNQVKGGGH
jgi:hypothetical protein